MTFFWRKAPHAFGGLAASVLHQTSVHQPSVECHSDRRFAGKTILITGGGGTIGTVGAKYFVEQGANVVLVDYNQAALDKVLEAVGLTRRIKACVCDVRDAAAVAKVVVEAKSAFGGIDLLWNNAGIQGEMKPLLEYPSSDVQAVMDINVVGAFNVLQAVAREMAATSEMVDGGSGGRGGGGGGRPYKNAPATSSVSLPANNKKNASFAVVQTGSVAGLRGTPTMGAYAASKAAIHGLTMTAAKDLAPYGIRVNTVQPALIGPEDGFMWVRQNELQAKSGSPYFSRDPVALARSKVNGVPLKRLGEVEEVVEAVAFLLSDEASYITGTSLVVAGGMA